MAKAKKYAAYCATEAIYSDIIPSLKSLLLHSDVDKVFLFLEHDEFIVPLPECVEVINAKDQKYFRPDGPNMKSHYTYMAMMRAALWAELPKINKILSLDCDTIIDRDISDIWDLPIKDCYFSACPEYHRTRADFLYTNVGVCLYNLKKLRDGKGKEIIEFLNTEQRTWMEQDTLNELCQGAIYPMPNEYNITPWTVHPPEIGRPDREVVIHFAGRNDWRNNPQVRHYRDMDWKTALNGRSWGQI